MGFLRKKTGSRRRTIIKEDLVAEDCAGELLMGPVLPLLRLPLEVSDLAVLVHAE